MPKMVGVAVGGASVCGAPCSVSCSDSSDTVDENSSATEIVVALCVAADEDDKDETEAEEEEDGCVVCVASGALGLLESVVCSTAVGSCVVAICCAEDDEGVVAAGEAVAGATLDAATVV